MKNESKITEALDKSNKPLEESKEYKSNDYNNKNDIIDSYKIDTNINFKAKLQEEQKQSLIINLNSAPDEIIREKIVDGNNIPSNSSPDANILSLINKKKIEAELKKQEEEKPLVEKTVLIDIIDSNEMVQRYYSYYFDKVYYNEIGSIANFLKFNLKQMK